METTKQTNKLGWILLVQCMVMLYSFVGVLSKVASARIQAGIFSFDFLIVVFAMIAVLGVYAILWQKALKHVNLSIAYANKGIGLFWTLLWSVLFFDESVKLQNVIGILLILIGIMAVTRSNE